ncbi:MAG: leucine--tRNA ligase [Saprospiraceae bacterium]
MHYHPELIEPKWRKLWDENQLYKVSNDSSKPKYYVLDMFPYPSGAGLHVGHPLGYIASDIYSRFKRLKGFNVLHPMGYDAFGLPAEQYAIQTGVHPAVSTDTNIKRYREQLDKIGFCYDWSREVKTSDPSYYKWTQWIFLRLFDHYYDLDENRALPISKLTKAFEVSGNTNVHAATGQQSTFSAAEWKEYSDAIKDQILMNYRLAYRKTSFVNWCEALGTVLANDEVKDGKSERGGFPVEKKAMLQWSLRITAYAERLLDELNDLEWTDSLKAMQRNWIGKSVGAQVFFQIQNRNENIEIFTTRPDTIFGATFMVLAPEHALVDVITTEDRKNEVGAYIDYVASRSDVDRLAEAKEVTGIFTGAYAVHPFTKKLIPIWLGEYVLKDYGTGAIMAVPSDDERDQIFAQKFGLDIIPVVDKAAYPQAGLHDKVGTMINSEFINGLEVKDAIEAVIKRLESLQIGARKVNYKLRDANFSRQRYWGEPFPIRYNSDGVSTSLEDSALPLTLPEIEDFKPASGGKSPLARDNDWVHQYDGYTLETDTMPGFAGSSWYFLRYMDPTNDAAFASKQAITYWRDVDVYIGGTEHAVGHLMYSRFWHKFLYDLGYVPTKEPFKKLINQGMITAYGYYASNLLFGMDDAILIGNAKDIDGELLNKNGRKYTGEGSPVRLPYILDYLDAQNRITKTKFDDYVHDIGHEYNVLSEHDRYSWVKDDEGQEYFTVNIVQEKMSKSKFNVQNPDEVVETYGADCFRMYEMFLGPIEQSKPWDTKGIDGVQKFLRKYWSLFFDENELAVQDSTPDKAEIKVLHTTIKKVSDDIERFSFNTCISAFMMCVNELKRLNTRSRAILEPLNVLLAPFAPYVTEELWQLCGHTTSVHNAAYPVFDPAAVEEEHDEYPICVNGKKRDIMEVPKGMSKNDIQHLAMSSDRVLKYVEGKEIQKVIVVPGRMINFVVKE